MSDYHDYVIKDGRLVGQFEEMYQNCADPWPETEEDLDDLAPCARTRRLVEKHGYRRILSLGSGTGQHLNWLAQRLPDSELVGVELSSTAVERAQQRYPRLRTICADVLTGVRELDFEPDLVVVRELVWYVLDDWDEICRVLLEKFKGAGIVVELSFYDRQQYGREFFSSPEELIEKFPFTLLETHRYHTTRLNKEGYLMIFGRIE